MDKDRDDNYRALFFRQEKLRKLLEYGSALLMGHMVEIDGYMEEDGAFSLKKTEEFVDRLMQALQVYLFYKRRSKWEDDVHSLTEYYRMPEDEEQYYRGYLYCTLITLYTEQAGKDDPVPVLFSDLVEKSRGLRLYPTYQDLLRQRYLDPDEYELAGGRFIPAEYALGPVPDLYRELCVFYDKAADFLKENKLTDQSGEIPVSASYPYCAKQQEWEAMLDSISETAKAKRQANIDMEQEWLNAILEQDRAELEAWAASSGGEDGMEEAFEAGHSEEDDLRAAELERKAEAAFERKKDILGKINLKRYWDYLRTVLMNQDSLYDQYNHVDAITGMINVFLMDEKVSILSDVDRFYSVYVRLESAFDLAGRSEGDRKADRRGRS